MRAREIPRVREAEREAVETLITIAVTVVVVNLGVVAVMVVGVKSLCHLQGVTTLVGDIVDCVDRTLMLLADIVPAIEITRVVEEALSLDRADKGNCQREDRFQGNHFVTKLQFEIE